MATKIFASRTCKAATTPTMSKTLRILFFVFAFIPSVTSLSFNFPNFNQTSLESIQFYGNASLNHNNNIIQLNENAPNTTDMNPVNTQSTGWAVYKQPLPLRDPHTRNLTDFTTHFSIVINTSFPADIKRNGDGLTFFLSDYPWVPPTDSYGGNLGLISIDSTAPRNFMAVEFDTYQNDWDYSSCHVGIDVDSIRSASYANCTGGIANGNTTSASVSYNSSTKTLSVVFRYYDDWYQRKMIASLSDVVDLSKLPDNVSMGFSASTGMYSESHQVLSWNFSSSLVFSPPKPENNSSVPSSTPKADTPTVRKERKIRLIVALLCALGTAMSVLGTIWFVLWRKKAKRQAGEEEELDCDVFIDDEFEKGKGPKRFTYNELLAATNNFAEEGKLGEGGFGEVYKGLLNDEEVAIKKVSAGSKQGKKEYISEVTIISRLRHRNLVQLVGWCHGRGEFLLMYQFMPNNSLDSHLYNQGRFLSWPVRYKISLGLASALLYLHEEWDQCVVHRDIKPSNVMLDSTFNAKLGDFGLARLMDHEIGSQTTVLAGTLGYLAPESSDIGRATKESDIYSFGIVALEIACARRPIEYGKAKLVEWVWELYGKGMILEAVDKKLLTEYDEKEIERLMIVGLWCAYPDHNLRPSIWQAIGVLNLEALLPDLPPKMPVPAFIAPTKDRLKSAHASFECSSSGKNSASTRFTANSSSHNISSG